MTDLSNFLAGLRENVNNISRASGPAVSRLEDIYDGVVDYALAYGNELQEASSELYSDDESVATWRKVLAFIEDTDIAINWRLGSWVNPRWEQPLPHIITLDKNFLRSFRGHPEIYMWRVSAVDLASAIPAGIAKLGATAAKRAVAALSDLGLSVALGVGINKVAGLSRSEDEIPDSGDYNVLFYLSNYKLAKAGYTYIDGTFPYQFKRTN